MNTVLGPHDAAVPMTTSEWKSDRRRTALDA
jgi:hypothetical protein